MFKCSSFSLALVGNCEILYTGTGILPGGKTVTNWQHWQEMAQNCRNMPPTLLAGIFWGVTIKEPKIVYRPQAIYLYRHQSEKCASLQ